MWVGLVTYCLFSIEISIVFHFSMASILAKKHWEEAVKKVKSLEDPWEDIDFDSLLERAAIRHVYNPRSKSWWQDEVLIKIQEKVS